MISYKHWIPPVLGTFNNKRYLLPIWQEVPLNTTLKDIQWDKPQPKLKLKIITETFVSSSDSNILYETKKIEEVDGSFKYSCTCPGAWRAKDKRCKHIKELEKRD